MFPRWFLPVSVALLLVGGIGLFMVKHGALLLALGAGIVGMFSYVLTVGINAWARRGRV